MSVLLSLSDGDRKLAKRLGLNHLPNLQYASWKTLGSYEYRDELGRRWSSVTVECSAMPAKFWRFTIRRGDIPDVQSMVISTGSGSLRDFWPTVEFAMSGMLHVDLEIEEKGENDEAAYEGGPGNAPGDRRD